MRLFTRDAFPVALCALSLTAGCPLTIRGSEGDGFPDATPTSDAVFVADAAFVSDAGSTFPDAALPDVSVDAGVGTRLSPCGEGTPVDTYPLAVAANGEHTCVLRRDGKVTCWGLNHLGQTAGSGELVANVCDVTQIAAGPDQSLAVRADGALLYWGWNLYGQSGTGNSPERVAPLRVPGLPAVEGAVASAEHVCAWSASGATWCWGLEIGTSTFVASPREVAGVSDVTSVVTASGISARFTCALRRDGTVWCWGTNSAGELGDGTDITRTTPAPVTGLDGVTQVSVGHQHGCAVRNDGTVWCWGRNDTGQLGDGTTSNRPRAAPVRGLSNVAEVALGDQRSCARTRDGVVSCWGRNDHGQLGDGTTIDRSLPARVSVFSAVTQLSAGFAHTCARTDDGSIWCWGSDANGQLRSRVSSGTALTPVRVWP